MNNYQKGKTAARETAIEWQAENANFQYSYGGSLILQEYFHKIGKRYGLLKEFRENGIPC